MLQKIIKHLVRMLKSRIRKILNIKKIKLHGVWIELTHDNISPELKDFFYNESYEGEEIGILSQHLSNDDVVMEIGAGIGFLSTYCAKKIGSKRVFAYEANPFMIDKIKDTYNLNNVNATIKNTLLSNREESINFYLEKNFWSSSTIKRSDYAKCIQIKSTNINQEIEKIKPNFLIIDIEGGERDLVPMIDFDNNNINKVIIEIHPHIIGEQDASNLISHFISKGFYLNFKEIRGIVFMFERRNEK